MLSLPSRSGRQKLAVCQEPKNSFFKYHFKKSQCMLILAARSKVYSDFLLCGCTTSTTLIVADRDVDQKMQVIKASVIEHVMKYLQHIQTFASLISYSIQLFINIFLRKSTPRVWTQSRFRGAIPSFYVNLIHFCFMTHLAS